MSDQTTSRIEISAKDLELDVVVDSAVSAGDFAKALETAGRIQHNYQRIASHLAIVTAQARAGLVADAKKTYDEAAKIIISEDTDGYWLESSADEYDTLNDALVEMASTHASAG